MASRLFRCVRKELVNPLLEQPKMKFSSSSSTGPGKSSTGATKPELTENEKRVQTVLKATAIFLPAVYLGHIMSANGYFGSSDWNKEQDKKKKDKKNKDKKDKEKKDKDEKAAKDKE